MSKNDYYIEINGEKIYVPEEMFREYKRAQWREQRSSRRRLGKELSLENTTENELTNKNEKLIEDIVIDRLLIEELHKALDELTNEEKELINELFFKNKSETFLSKETGIPQRTLNHRKHRILKK